LPLEEGGLKVGCKEAFDLLSTLEEALGAPGLPKALGCEVLLCAEREEGCVEVFCASSSVLKLAELAAPSTGKLLHVGVHLGRVRSGRVEPSLHAAYLIATALLKGALEARRGVVVVTSKRGELAFSRSAPIGEGDYEAKEKSPSGLCLVLSKHGDALGWGTATSRGLVVPIVDCGWYLRAGL